jgi:hypothetical protein
LAGGRDHTFQIEQPNIGLREEWAEALKRVIALFNPFTRAAVKCGVTRKDQPHKGGNGGRGLCCG